MRVRVSLNGKFLAAPLEGMPRVAGRLIMSMDALLKEDRGYRDNLDLELLYPPGASPIVGLEHIACRQVGRLTGQLWEQIDFPWHSRGRLSVNLTSTGPLLKRDCLSLIHDAQMFSTPASFHAPQRWLYRVITPAIGHVHRQITTVSQFSREQIEHYHMCPHGKAVVIPNAADHMLGIEADESVLDRLGLRDAPFFLANAYSHQHKNVQILFKALELLRPLRHRLVLFGQSSRERYESNGIHVPADVIFTGRISDRELVALMRHAQVFAFPSLTEGFGLPPLEAMTLGTPCLVSTGGAMPEVCRDGVMYANPTRANEWAEGLRTLAEDAELRATVARRGREVAATYSWHESAAAYLDTLLGHARASRVELSESYTVSA